jgi:hypothetical protein
VAGQKGAFEQLSFPWRESVALEHQVVRTGFLQPQNFAWISGPDLKEY